MKIIKLDSEELAGGYSLKCHGAHLPMDEMKQRVLGTHPKFRQSPSSSMFFSRQIHEDAVNDFFTQNQVKFKAYFQVGNVKFADNFDFQIPVGIGFKNIGTDDNPQIQSIPTMTTIVRIVFKANTNHPRGFFLLTAYPLI